MGGKSENPLKTFKLDFGNVKLWILMGEFIFSRPDGPGSFTLQNYD